MDGLSSYDGPTMHIILEIPADTYHLDIVAKTVDGNEEEHAYTTRMTLSDIRQAREDFRATVPGGDDFDKPMGRIVEKRET